MKSTCFALFMMLEVSDLQQWGPPNRVASEAYQDNSPFGMLEP